MITEQRREGSAMLLWQTVLSFDWEVGFNIAIHEQYPTAPHPPYYFNFRRLPAFHASFDIIAGLCVDAVGEVTTSFNLVCDVPESATPLTTLFAHKLQKPMLRPRLNRKAHGARDELNGVWSHGDRVLVFDDVRTTGGSKKPVIDLLQRHGLDVVRVFVVVDLGAEEGEPISNVKQFSSVWTGSWLFSFFERWKDLTAEQAAACRSYPRRLAEYLRSATSQV